MKTIVSLLTFALCTVSLTAQDPVDAHHIDTDTKKALLAKVQDVIADRQGVRLLATPRVLAIYSCESKSKADIAAADDQARTEALLHARMFDICERLLPLHDKCGELFLVLDSEGLLATAWKLQEQQPDGSPLSLGTVPMEFARAQQFQVSGILPAVSFWAVYEKAWFGSSPPAEWYRRLAIARVNSELQAMRQQAHDGKKSKPIEPFTKQMAREWARLDRKEIDQFLASIAPGLDQGRSDADALSPSAALTAAFLGHAKEDLKKKFQPHWGTFMQDYAARRLAGEPDSNAGQAALGKLDRKELAAAMQSWAKARSR